MLDEIITAAILLAFIYVILSKSKFATESEHLFTKEYSTVLKGICCIVVVLVHIPADHSSKLQDTVGSFAYVAVTIFFLLSGYGLGVSRKKEGYLDNFWKSRIPALLIPMIIVNVVSLITNYICDNDISHLRTLLNINGFTLMLGLCYIAFYFTYRVKGLNDDIKRIIACIFIVGISLLTYVFEEKIPFTVWPVPCLGFIYGLVIDDFKDLIILKLNKHRLVDIQSAVLFLASIIAGGGYLKTKTIVFWGDYVIRALLAVLLIALLIKITSKIELGNCMLNTLGVISYEIYLSHGIVMGVLDSFFPNLRPGFYIAATLAGTIVVAFGVNKIDKALIVKARTILIK